MFRRQCIKTAVTSFYVSSEYVSIVIGMTLATSTSIDTVLLKHNRSGMKQFTMNSVWSVELIFGEVCVMFFVRKLTWNRCDCTFDRKMVNAIWFLLFSYEVLYNICHIFLFYNLKLLLNFPSLHLTSKISQKFHFWKILKNSSAKFSKNTLGFDENTLGFVS